ncbi:MAG: diphosphomevalonate decarboxylase [candidate division KSB1 bacterium]|nr:diphosphomevalonate decarboxylase [candidate division KSB1 bacterium]
MTKQETVRALIGDRLQPKNSRAEAFAPVNIALCKYWGKRNEELNLPMNGSLSVSLGRLGTRTRLSITEGGDEVILNGRKLAQEESFARRVSAYLDLFRPPNAGFRIETENTIPTGAGLASSASGFAALAMALNRLFGWELDGRALSILARLGSGSAARSVFTGFVEWFAGERKDGLDSYAAPLSIEWPELRIGAVVLSAVAKPIGSTAGMKQTVRTSLFYRLWPQRAENDLAELKRAIAARDFQLLGTIAEANALAMHATMIDSRPPVFYWLPETISAFQTVWRLRQDGVGIYFTIDAGANVKMLFLAHNLNVVRAAFPQAEIIEPFASIEIGKEQP